MTRGAAQVEGFAARVLTGTSLADKLAPPGDDPVPSGPISVPEPGRAPALALKPLVVPAPPPVRALRSDDDRARVLHAMANHELLALELFAHALLAFPELPARHRGAIVTTMVDEQRHLRLYLDRLAETGAELGSQPMSRFFWDALRPVDDARAFLAGLSLVLEQANLDFARHWQRAFAAAGDPATAEVLDAVYRDEIRHVRAGWAAFRDLSPPGEADWAGFRRVLVPPLSVARARGPALDREGRRLAGLPDDFVAELATAGGSRGRLPTVFVPNLDAEDELAGRDRPAPTGLGAVAAFLASAEDQVVAPRPSTAFLEGLRARGFVVPAFVGAPDGLVHRVVPFASTPATDPEWDPRRAAVYAKSFGPSVGGKGAVCATLDEVRAVLAEAGPRGVVAKALLSSAGAHRMRFAAIDARVEAFVARSLPLVVEPWLEVLAEISVHATVEPDRVRVDGLTRFGAHGGVYRGTVLGPVDLGLPRALVRFLAGDGDHTRAARERLSAAARRVGEAARAHGHRGPLSIDALVVAGPDGPALVEIGEVNPRITMSRVAMALRDRLHARAVGAWWFVPAALLRRVGLPPDALQARLDALLPARVEGGRTRVGGFATTEPTPDAPITTWALVSDRWADVRGAADALVAAHPGLASHLAWV